MASVKSPVERPPDRSGRGRTLRKWAIENVGPRSDKDRSRRVENWQAERHEPRLSSVSDSFAESNERVGQAPISSRTACPEITGRRGRITNGPSAAVAAGPVAENTTPRRPMSTEPMPTAPQKPLLLWPAVAVLALYWAGNFVVARLETFYFVGFLFNLASTALVAIFFLAWWWFSRRIPLRNRLYGFLLIIGGALIVEPFCHPSIGWWGLLMSGLPIVLTAWVLWMIVAKKMPAPRRRAGSLCVVLPAFSYCPLIRMDGRDSNLRANVNWRWNPSAEDLFLAEKSNTAHGATRGTQKHSQAAETVSLRPGDWPEFRGP